MAAMQPMPPKAGPMPSSPMPAGDQSGGDQGGGVKELVTTVGSGLRGFSAILDKTGQVPDEYKQRAMELSQEFDKLISDMASGKSSGGDANEGGEMPAASGNVPMEAGANPNVKPAM